MVFGVSWGHHFLFRPYDLDVSSMISGFLGIVSFSVSSASAGLEGLAVLQVLVDVTCAQRSSFATT